MICVYLTRMEDVKGMKLVMKSENVMCTHEMCPRENYIISVAQLINGQQLKCQVRVNLFFMIE